MPFLDGVAPRTPKLGPARTSVTAATARTARSSACLNLMPLPFGELVACPFRPGQAILKPLSTVVKQLKQLLQQAPRAGELRPELRERYVAHALTRLRGRDRGAFRDHE